MCHVNPLKKIHTDSSEPPSSPPIYSGEESIRRKKRRRQRGAILLLLLVMAIGVYFFNPFTTTFFPKCPFLVFTGYKCPGCGSGRALYCLVHEADFSLAWHYNPALLIGLSLIFLLLLTEILGSRFLFWKRIHLFVCSPLFSYIIIVVILGWWILRNVFGL